MKRGLVIDSDDEVYENIFEKKEDAEHDLLVISSSDDDLPLSRVAEMKVSHAKRTKEAQMKAEIASWNAERPVVLHVDCKHKGMEMIKFLKDFPEMVIELRSLDARNKPELAHLHEHADDFVDEVLYADDTILFSPDQIDF